MQPSEPSQSPSPDTDFCALTSVADTLAQRLGMKPLPTTASRFALGPRLGAAWANTLPIGLDEQLPPERVCEPLLGLQIREMAEPEVFSHFFGSNARR